MGLSIPSISVVYFFIYAILGWFCEVIYCAIIDRQIENRGFLHGPYCPIYGFGATIVLYLLTPLASSPVLLFFAAVIACSVLEYFTGWAMEKIFHMRWWDYSKLPYNLHGRVCLLNSALFGILGLALVYLVHPFISLILQKIPQQVYPTLSIFIILAMTFDFVISAKSLFNAASQLAELKVHYEQFKELQAQKRLQFKESIKETWARLCAQQKDHTLPLPGKLLWDKLRSINLKNRKLQQMLRSPGSMNLQELDGALQMLHSYLEEPADQIGQEGLDKPLMENEDKQGATTIIPLSSKED